MLGSYLHGVDDKGVLMESDRFKKCETFQYKIICYDAA